jgi:chloramphenicol-sensitive protein RarD
VTAGRAAGRDTTGLFFGLGAYLSGGVFPAFFPLLKPAGPAEILAHRIVWTVLLMVAVLVVVGRLSDVRSLSRRTWLLLVCASALISTNWLIYIYAVNSGHVVDAALGYFINPLVSVLLGVVLFGERLNRAQAVAVFIAVVAVALLFGGAGGAPWIAVILAVSFGLYGAVKKVVPADPRVSVAMEAAIASPFAVGYLAMLQLGGTGQFTGNGAGHVVLLLLCGPITAVPLLCFAAAAQRLPLVTLGLLQYLTPSMQMTWGLEVGHESMTPLRWTGFAMIWLALAVFSTDALRRARARR